MTYEEAIDYVLSKDINDLTLKKALNYLKFVNEVNMYRRTKKLTTNEMRKLNEILESK